jgi:AbrB family looped-hinge helix DNA binding protein
MIKKHKNKNGERFYGVASIGEKGQIVIPIEARRKMDAKKGDKLLVFSMGNDMIAITKFSKVEQIASHLSTRLNVIRSIIKKIK